MIFEEKEKKAIATGAVIDSDRAFMEELINFKIEDKASMTDENLSKYVEIGI